MQDSILMASLLLADELNDIKELNSSPVASKLSFEAAQSLNIATKRILMLRQS